jgi:hypothetical protein
LAGLRGRLPGRVAALWFRFGCVHNVVVRMAGRALPFVCLIGAGAAAGYVYLFGVLSPVRPAAVCGPANLHGWSCASYEIMISRPFFVILGALIGAWIAYAAVRLVAAPARRSFTWQEGLAAGVPLVAMIIWVAALRLSWAWAGWATFGWAKVLIFLLAAALLRLAIGIASIAKMRGRLIIALGMPLLLAGIGYAFSAIVRLPLVGHGCPALPSESASAIAAACAYHPLIGEAAPWAFLGLLAGTWLAYAIAVGVATPHRQGQPWLERSVTVPVIAAVLSWAVAVGSDQAGGGYEILFVLAVSLAILLRLCLGTGLVKTRLQAVLTAA